MSSLLASSSPYVLNGISQPEKNKNSKNNLGLMQVKRLTCNKILYGNQWKLILFLLQNRISFFSGK